jgi:hypothetical protein
MAVVKTVMAIHATVAWFVILALAIANGALREALLIPALGLRFGTAHSGILLIGVIWAVAFTLVRWRKIRRPAHAWWIGVCWLVATLAFEFGFGRIRGASWPELLDAYTFQNGNLWPLVMATVLLAPSLCHKTLASRAEER